MERSSLQRTLYILLIAFLTVAGLYFAKPFLVPVCLAGLFAMFFLPLSRRFEKWGVNKGLAAVFCLLTFLFVISGIILLVSWQLSNLTSDLGSIEEKVRGVWKQASEYISQTFGISPEKQEEVIEKQAEGGEGEKSIVAKIGGSLMSLIVDFILMMVYIFLFLYYRSHIKKFILKLVAKKDEPNTKDAIQGIEKVSQKYLMGMGIMIVCLWVMYSIGFTILGLKNPIFFAMLCGLFEIIPFVGNLTGNALAVLMALTQGGGMGMVIGILITYAIIQFLQTYILEPMVVGSEVNINPLFTIIVLVIGELIWGIAGLVLAIPLLGIVKIICNHIPALQPYGFLIGKEKSEGRTFKGKIQGWFKKDKK